LVGIFNSDLGVTDVSKISVGFYLQLIFDHQFLPNWEMGESGKMVVTWYRVNSSETDRNLKLLSMD